MTTAAVDTTPRRRRSGVPGAPEGVQPDPDQRPVETDSVDGIDDIEINLTGAGGGVIDEGIYLVRVESIEFKHGDDKNPRFPVKVKIITEGKYARRILPATLTVMVDEPEKSFFLWGFVAATGGFTEEELKALNSGDRALKPSELIRKANGADMWAEVVKSSDPKYLEGREVNKIKAFSHVSAH